MTTLTPDQMAIFELCVGMAFLFFAILFIAQRRQR